MSKRRVVHSPSNRWPPRVEVEEKTSEKVVEEEKKEIEAEKVVEEQTREVFEEYTAEEKQRHRCKEKTMMYGKLRPKRRGRPGKSVADAAPKRRGRPRRCVADVAPKKSDYTPPHASKGRGKRKSEPSQWLQTPFTEGKKPKTKA
ncbi:hypothetical protein Bca4012_099171 [Brassica carinata]|uniref:Uncharacterized protein n=2 Tax=Brassica TaxID=3705 RepID=A0A8S9PR61_BRACR|nr:hypothetical protein F2Q69_00048399 [Brassica cretica]CAF2057650.1 unnamed protein product [Brassica napus]